MRRPLVLASIVLATAGCGLSPEPEPGPPDCSPCTAETADLGDEIKRLDGVRRIERIEYVTARGITRQPGVRLVVRVRPGRLQSVVDAVTELAWKSDVAPLAVVDVTSLEPGEGPEETSIFYDGREVDAYEAAWGPRPQ